MPAIKNLTFGDAGDSTESLKINEITDKGRWGVKAQTTVKIM